MNKKVATLNVPAIWLRIPSAEMSVRKYEAFPYEQDGIRKGATADTPVFRYAENHKVGELEFSLCMFSDEKSEKNVSSYFKKLVKDMTEAQISMALVKSTASSFMYIENESYGGNK